MNYETQYLTHLKALLGRGRQKDDRTGTGTVSIFGHQMRADLRLGFPLLTSKKVHLKSIIHELLWFINGDTNIKYLKDNGVKIWDEWASESGELGPVYGKQWRSWSVLHDVRRMPGDELLKKYPHARGWELSDVMSTDDDSDSCELAGREIDQLKVAIDTLTNNPESRRIIVSAWNVGEREHMALPPCHLLFQFNASPMSYGERSMWADRCGPAKFRGMNEAQMDEAGVPRYFLDCQLYQRSADWFLGVPFNVASYALLTMMMAKEVNMVARDFVHTFGDTHLYLNHFEQAKQQLGNKTYQMPTMELKDRGQSLFEYRFEDFELSDYESAPAIKAPVAV